MTTRSATRRIARTEVAERVRGRIESIIGVFDSEGSGEDESDDEQDEDDKEQEDDGRAQVIHANLSHVLHLQMMDVTTRRFLLHQIMSRKLLRRNESTPHASERQPSDDESIVEGEAD